jgi:hypothetical protein
MQMQWLCLRRNGHAPWRLEAAADLLAAYDAVCADRPAEDLLVHPAFVDAALHPLVLSTVTAAMGLVPHLECIEVYVSRPSSDALSISQPWHRDVNDKATIKLFVYLNDVDDDTGPFTFIPADCSERVPRNLAHYMSHAQISGFVSGSDWRRTLGGTAFLIDTSRCLDFGSRT